MTFLQNVITVSPLYCSYTIVTGGPNPTSYYAIPTIAYLHHSNNESILHQTYWIKSEIIFCRYANSTIVFYVSCTSLYCYMLYTVILYMMLLLDMMIRCGKSLSLPARSFNNIQHSTCLYLLKSRLPIYLLLSSSYTLHRNTPFLLSCEWSLSFVSHSPLIQRIYNCGNSVIMPSWWSCINNVPSSSSPFQPSWLVDSLARDVL